MLVGQLRARLVVDGRPHRRLPKDRHQIAVLQADDAARESAVVAAPLMHYQVFDRQLGASGKGSYAEARPSGDALSLRTS